MSGVDPEFVQIAKRIVESDAAWAALETKIERAAVRALADGCLIEEFEVQLTNGMRRAQRILFEAT